MAHSYTDQGCRVPLFPASPQELVRISAKFSPQTRRSIVGFSELL